MVKGKGKRRIDDERKIRREELRRIFGKLKDGKATIVDSISSEIWKYGGQELENWERILNRIWRGEGWPEE